jgi:hypothetical protein
MRRPQLAGASKPSDDGRILVRNGQVGSAGSSPAHTALVSEADFITAQDAAAPRGPAAPAVRRYLLAGLLACGRCNLGWTSM